MAAQGHRTVADVTAGLEVRRLGRIRYALAYRMQLELHEAVRSGQIPAAVLFLEHDPVITVSRRRGAWEHVLASPQRLAELGIELQETDRGGDVTYHGPGQLVAYPIFRLTDLRLSVGGYMRFLEELVIQTLGVFGIAGRRYPPHTGVWVEGPGGRLQKICALGVRVRRNVTMHGLALNVSPDLSHFQLIVPCGLVGLGVTSMHEVLGADCPSLDRVTDELERQIRRAVRQQMEAKA